MTFLERLCHWQLVLALHFTQHYPLYRKSDAECSGEDAASPEEKTIPFKEKYDVLSQEASQKVFSIGSLSIGGWVGGLESGLGPWQPTGLGILERANVCWNELAFVAPAYCGLREAAE